MDGFFGFVFVAIWIVVIVSMARASVKQREASRQARARLLQQNAPLVQQNMNLQPQQGQTFRTTAGATSGTTRPFPTMGQSRPGVKDFSYGQGAFAKTPAKSIAEIGVLLEDRRNDWLAKQLREEAAIKRRGSIYDLGAAHDADCDADRIRRLHISRHNTNGLNRQTFR